MFWCRSSNNSPASMRSCSMLQCCSAPWDLKVMLPFTQPWSQELWMCYQPWCLFISWTKLVGGCCCWRPVSKCLCLRWWLAQCLGWRSKTTQIAWTKGSGCWWWSWFAPLWHLLHGLGDHLGGSFRVRHSHLRLGQRGKVLPCLRTCSSHLLLLKVSCPWCATSNSGSSFSSPPGCLPWPYSQCC